MHRRSALHIDDKKPSPSENLLLLY